MFTVRARLLYSRPIPRGFIQGWHKQDLIRPDNKQLKVNYANEITASAEDISSLIVKGCPTHLRLRALRASTNSTGHKGKEIITGSFSITIA